MYQIFLPSNPNPDYTSDFARNGDESAFPEMWDGLFGTWVPSLGPNDELEDHSGNGNPGVLTNLDITDWQGDILDFPGTNEWVNCGDIDAIDTATQLTLLASVRLDDIDADHYIIENNDGFNNGGFLFFFDDVSAASGRTNVFRVIVYDSGSGNQRTLESDNNSVVAGQWFDLAVTIDLIGFDLRMYIDAVEVADSPVNINVISAIDAGVAPLAIGAHQDLADRYFNGQMRRVLVYDKILDANEIQQHYRNPKGPFIRKAQLIPFVAAAPDVFVPQVIMI